MPEKSKKSAYGRAIAGAVEEAAKLACLLDYQDGDAVDFSGTNSPPRLRIWQVAISVEPNVRSYADFLAFTADTILRTPRDEPYCVAVGQGDRPEENKSYGRGLGYSSSQIALNDVKKAIEAHPLNLLEAV
ncbi:MAG: hypothetical protein V1820_03005 [archaeon]